MNRSQNVQLMRPGLLAPFLAQLDLRRLDSTRLLSGIELTRRQIRDNAGMVTARQVHTFIRAAAKASGDPFFSWTTGINTDPRKYLLYANLVSRNNTLGETLTRLSLAATGLSTATRFELLVQGTVARLSGHRLYRSEPEPHTDAFVIGTLVALTNYFLGGYRAASQLSISTYDPGPLPRDFGCRLIATSDIPNRITLEFPTSWLLNKPGQKPTEMQVSGGPTPESDFVEFLASALETHLDDPGLTAEKAASICDGRLREINGVLKPEGVTLADLISEWRAKKACSMLRKSDERIAEIGVAVGYPNATSFSRVFRHWTGLSPRQYRRAHS